MALIYLSIYKTEGEINDLASFFYWEPGFVFQNGRGRCTAIRTTGLMTPTQEIRQPLRLSCGVFWGFWLLY